MQRQSDGMYAKNGIAGWTCRVSFKPRRISHVQRKMGGNLKRPAKLFQLGLRLTRRIMGNAQSAFLIIGEVKLAPIREQA